jgi:putative ABC transport system ATP-binding protein
MPNLVIDGLTVEYGSGIGEVTRPLDGFDMVAPAGSLALLLGPSGSGKTTLLSCLAAILSPARGTVSFGDVTVSELAGKERTLFRRRTVGIVFQAFNLVPSLSAAENVMAPLLAAGRSRAEAATRAAELLDRVELSHRSTHRPGELSGGQQQRVAIARALVQDPPLLLADEPTAHLDHTQVEGVLGLLAGLMDGERVMVIATHDDRVLTLGGQRVDLGRRAADGSGPIGSG